jgi:mannosylglycoprotein endo-beta-mannosidase
MSVFKAYYSHIQVHYCVHDVSFIKYGILDEKLFFDRNPGLTTPLLSEDEVQNNVQLSEIENADSPGRNIGFQTEIGSVSHPELGSLRRFLNQNALDSFPECGVMDEKNSAIHHEWSYYKYLPFTESTNDSTVDHICQFRYPPIDATSNRMDSIDDYSWSAQLAQYFQYKSLFEGYYHRMFEDHSAVFVWKSSSPAPTLRGALYDWYLDTNGGYWGARLGIGDDNPLKVILNLQDWHVHLCNVLSSDIIASHVAWRAYTLDGKLVDGGTIEIPNRSIKGNSVTHLHTQIPWVGANQTPVMTDVNLQEVLYYQLEVSLEEDRIEVEDGTKQKSNNSGKTTNFYYLTDPDPTDLIHRQTRFASLGAMRKVMPKVRVNASCNKNNLANAIECALANNDERLAIMVKLSLVNDIAIQGNQILPTLFSNNYITLLPGETTIVHASPVDIELMCSNGSLTQSTGPASLIISIDGWNLQEDSVVISCDN